MDVDALNLMEIYENQIEKLKNMEGKLNINLENINSTIMSQYKKILDSIPNNNDKINCSIIPNDLIAKAQKMAFNNSENCLKKPSTAFNDFFAFGIWVRIYMKFCYKLVNYYQCILFEFFYKIFCIFYMHDKNI